MPDDEDQPVERGPVTDPTFSWRFLLGLVILGIPIEMLVFDASAAEAVEAVVGAVAILLVWNCVVGRIRKRRSASDSARP